MARAEMATVYTFTYLFTLQMQTDLSDLEHVFKMRMGIIHQQGLDLARVSTVLGVHDLRQMAHLD